MKIFRGDSTPDEKLYVLRSNFVTFLFLGFVCIASMYLAVISIPFFLVGFYLMAKYFKLKKQMEAENIENIKTNTIINQQDKLRSSNSPWSVFRFFLIAFGIFAVIFYLFDFQG